MAQSKEEKILLKILYIAKSKAISEQALQILEGEQIDFMNVPLDDLLTKIYPTEEWVKYVCSQVNLHISIAELEKKREIFKKTINTQNEHERLKLSSMLYAITPIVREVYLEKYNRSINVPSSLQKASKGASAILTLAFILGVLGLRSEAQVRRYLKAVISNRMRFSEYQVTLPTMGGIMVLFDYLEYLIKVWHTRYGYTKNVSNKQQHWHFEMSELERTKSMVLNMLSTLISGGALVGKSRFSIELDMVGEDDECLIYTKFLSKYTFLLFKEGYFGKMCVTLGRQLAEVGDLPTEFIAELKDESEWLWESSGIEDFNEDWDLLSIESACVNDPKAFKEIVGLLYGN